MQIMLRQASPLVRSCLLTLLGLASSAVFSACGGRSALDPYDRGADGGAGASGHAGKGGNGGIGGSAGIGGTSGVGGAAGTTPIGRCGDGTCNINETHDSCPVDCTGERCGDGRCNRDESFESCPADCQDQTD